MKLFFYGELNLFEREKEIEICVVGVIFISDLVKLTEDMNAHNAMLTNICLT